MQIARDTVVTLHYRVTDPSGNLIDDGKQPLVYLHGGYGGLFAHIEEVLQGKGIGDALEVKLQPEDAFAEGIQVGMQFERTAEEGEDNLIYTITDIEEGKVVVDGNHPLAGVPLVFLCTVTEVRAATAEELEHGHVHGLESYHHH